MLGYTADEVVNQITPADISDPQEVIARAHYRGRVKRRLQRGHGTGNYVPRAGDSVRSRDGHTGARRAGDIGFATLRGGSVVGDHTVVFAGQGERIELAHRAEDRSIFARGAVTAALWGQDRKPGYYTMADVLGLSAL